MLEYNTISKGTHCNSSNSTHNFLKRHLKKSFKYSKHKVRTEANTLHVSQTVTHKLANLWSSQDMMNILKNKQLMFWYNMLHTIHYDVNKMLEIKNVSIPAINTEVINNV